MIPPALKITSNLGALDIILASAGKGNAVRYLRERAGYAINQTIGIGDDINDIEFLNETGNQYVLGSAYPEVLEAARKNKWYISSGLHFDGINEILRTILQGGV